MIRQSVLTLVAESGYHGVFDTCTQTRRTVMCEVKSVGMQEVYRARADGLNPSIVFVLSDYAEYQGERLCEFENVTYKVIRTYTNKQKIEIVCEEANAI